MADGVRGIARLEELADAPLDAVINLAGAPIADRPWTNKRKALLWGSRVALTERLLAWLEARPQRPRVLLSGSAVGWYGDGGERELDEDDAPVVEDFAAQLCVAWEETAQRAEALGMRVVLLRTGLVLAPARRLSQAPAAAVPPGPGWADRQRPAVDAVDSPAGSKSA